MFHMPAWYEHATIVRGCEKCKDSDLGPNLTTASEIHKWEPYNFMTNFNGIENDTRALSEVIVSRTAHTLRVGPSTGH
eukprot:198080-Pelagomonas_calceolata.AAC.1